MQHQANYWLKRLRIAIRHSWANGGLIFLLAILALAPVLFEPKMQLESVVQDTLFVIDISESMNVRDVDYPKPQSDRLSLAKHAVSAAMASLPCGSKVSIGLFAGDETIVLFEPLEVCGHYPAIEEVVMRLDSRMRWIGDSWVIRAMVSAIKEAEKRKLNLVMLTDADEMPHKSAPRISELLEYKGKLKGLLLGIGGEAPQPVPRLDGHQQIMSYWTPEEAVLEGNHPNLLAYVKALKPGEEAPAGMLDEVGEHLSAFNRSLLQSAAQATAFSFAHIKTPSDAVQSMHQANFEKTASAERDARWIFGLISILLVLIAWFWQSISSRFAAKTQA